MLIALLGLLPSAIIWVSRMDSSDCRTNRRKSKGRLELDTVDRQTGEIYESWVIETGVQCPDWFHQYQAALDILLDDETLTMTETKVLWLFQRQMGYGNFVLVTHRYIADRLKKKRQNISVAIKKLMAKGWLEEGPSKSGMRSYRVSPERAWKGKAPERQRIAASKLKLVVNNKSSA